MEIFRVSPCVELAKGKKVNLYKGLEAMVEMSYVERREEGVFKHGTFPDINIVS
ncbi:hypothetical protein [uncultured Paraglaciecola sp.]|uniref:hypothetical protein n=1 Tax=uncultured Paraglaciecola sp. TaxID=1765024 RepID=UPI0025945B64|nr:hypothetical protein [uncultured Paraglaciecola sp.]